MKPIDIILIIIIAAVFVGALVKTFGKLKRGDCCSDCSGCNCCKNGKKQ